IVCRILGTLDKSNLNSLLPGALLGTLAGALTFSITNADMIRILVGVLALYFVAHYLWGLRMLQHAQRTEAGIARGTFWGTIAGYTSYIAHAGGPPVSIYLLPQCAADRKSTRLNSSHVKISYAVFCLKKKKKHQKSKL